MKYIDNFLNSITMYRLMVYGLGVLIVISMLLSWFGFLPFSPLELLFSTIILLLVCNVVNYGIAKLYKAPINIESASITALILVFLLAPPISTVDFFTLIAAGVIAIISKYVLAINKKHIFNPAAIAAVIIGVAGSGLVIWWVSSSSLLIFVFIFGLLIVRKIRRFNLFGIFLLTSFALLVLPRIVDGQNIFEVTKEILYSWPLIFLGAIMLTEPLTTPPSRQLQIMYAVLVGCLFSLQFRFGPIFSTPELALVIGNIFSYIVSPKKKLRLILQSSRALSNDIYEFIFSSSEKLTFKAGQYLEWTFPRLFLESRGNRRYFTIASAPTENEIHLGIRISPNGSRFKQELVKMKPGEELWASQLTGDFILPENKQTKLLCIAGGVGITPFRSMVKYLLDSNESRDIILLYACWSVDSFVYQDIFSEAEKKLGIKVVYIISDQKNIPLDWQGKAGFIDEKLLQEIAPDYKDRQYYLSGPNVMVKTYSTLLSSIGIKRKAIKKDYFPGF
jgi:ferredoxin-NADP reductase